MPLQSKDQGATIRPVYVGADDNDETKPVDASNFEIVPQHYYSKCKALLSLNKETNKLRL